MRAAGRSIVLAGVLLASCAARSERETPRPATTSQSLRWSAGSIAPIRIRSGHTATLLGTNELLLAGGEGTSARTTELLDPYSSRSVPGPELVEPRTDHTATMLLSGKVLLAGGTLLRTNIEVTARASAEVYDPIARTSTATAPMAKPRRAHGAIRLRSGKVLVAGGADDLSTEIFDPATGMWSPGPTRVGSRALGGLATLADGRVLAVGIQFPATNTTEVLDANATAWSVITQGFQQAGGVTTLTRLPDGRVVNGWSQGCGFTGSTIFCDSFTSIYEPGGTTVDGPTFIHGRDFFTAVRTIEGNVLFMGGEPIDETVTVEQLDNPAAVRLSNEGTTTTAHVHPTATVIAGGDILLSGGAQAALDRRVSPGRWTTAPFLLERARERHSATRLHDGTVLIAGGENVISSGAGGVTTIEEAEVIDRAAGTKPKLLEGKIGRHLHGTLTTLRDGRALYVGGETNAVEVYTPATERFAAGPPLATARTGHSATILPSGKLLVIGGAAADDAGTLASTEIFDPTTNVWTNGPAPVNAWREHGAVLMPNGLVLVVGGGVAEIFDEVKMAFRPTTAPGAARDGRTAHLLPSGKVFVAGGSTLSAEVFDPITETWSFTAPQLEEAADRQWTGLPSGKLVPSGGHYPVELIAPVKRVFDPLAHPTGSFLEIATEPQRVYWHSATLAGTGEIVVTGGQPAFHIFTGDSYNEISIYGDGALESLRPEVTDLPATVTAGTKVQIGGSGFANAAEASSGTRASSAVNHPTAVWVSDQGDAVVPSTLLDFTDTTATWLVPTTALYGHGLLFVNVGGVMSRGKSVTITPALAATACENDAQCKTGFCTDGVCCDRRCDGVCEGCSKATKTSGEDGVCGAVPPGVGRCFLKLGDPCKGANECGTGFCAQGVCCDSTCDAQCLSCNLQGKAGRCSAINEGACGAACDGDHTLKQIGVEDVDCAPYKCSGPQCNQTCASARDCVAPAVCSTDGKCVPPVAPPAGTDSVCGCRAVGATPRTWTGAWTLALVALLAGRRRRRS